MKTNGRILLCLAAVVAVAVAATPQNLAGEKNGAEAPKYPLGVSEAARAFKSAPGSGRFSQATNLIELLPKCPEKSRRDTGTGRIVSFDYSKPSYILRRGDVAELLGAPSSIETNSFSSTYIYLAGKRHNLGAWLLWIEFRNDYVVRSGLRAEKRAE